MTKSAAKDSAFAAASVANVAPMRAGFEAMRLGAIIYFVPFFFVFNPALLLQGSAIENVQAFTTAILGVAIVSGALQGYLLGVGNLGSGTEGFLVNLSKNWQKDMPNEIVNKINSVKSISIFSGRELIKFFS